MLEQWLALRTVNREVSGSSLTVVTNNSLILCYDSLIWGERP